jgi:hypothetical protein
VQGFFRGKAFCLVGGLFFHVCFREESCLFRSFCPKLPGDRILLCTLHFGTGFPAFILLLPLYCSLFLIPDS